MALILSGTKAQVSHVEILKKRVSELQKTPCLVIIQVGQIQESTAYINQKKKMGVLVGVEVKHISLSENTSELDLIQEIKKHNTDNSVDGILVQLPLPVSLDKEKIIEIIEPSKDVDGLTLTNQQALNGGRTDIPLPATARAVLSLLSFYGIGVRGRRVAVLGRSTLVGKPTAKLLESAGALVTICHSKTSNIPKITKDADIIIVAIGKPGLIDERFLSGGQVIIDVGINVSIGKGGARELIGDVAFERVLPFVSAITPVPGGVGPMTVMSLFENVVDGCVKKV